jgi:leucyl aminopeptidase
MPPASKVDFREVLVEIKVVTGDIAGTKADATIINYFEGMKRLEGDTAALDKALDGAITQLIKQGELKGKCGEATIIHSLGKLPADRVVVMGLGKQAELTPDKIRGAIASTCRLLRKKYVTSVATIVQGNGIAGISPEASAQAMTEGALLGLYNFRRHLTKEAEYGEIKQLTIVSPERSEATAIRRGVEKGRILAEATNLARDMVNEPSNRMTPTDMAEMATSVAKTYGLDISVFEREQAEKMGMGAFLGVAKASQQPPKFIVDRKSVV